jgi:hypothetical protein
MAVTPRDGSQQTRQLVHRIVGAMDEVILQYSPNWAEFRRAQVGISHAKVVLLVAGVSFMAILGGVAAVWDRQWLALAIGELFWFVTLSCFLWYWPRDAWKFGAGSQEPRRLTISDAGILRSSDSLDVTFTWDGFTKVRESDEFFVLRPTWRENSFSIPKRTLSSSQETELRELLARHLPITSTDRGFFLWLSLFAGVVLLTTFLYVVIRIGLL